LAAPDPDRSQASNASWPNKSRLLAVLLQCLPLLFSGGCIASTFGPAGWYLDSPGDWIITVLGFFVFAWGLGYVYLGQYQRFVPKRPMGGQQRSAVSRRARVSGRFWRSLSIGLAVLMLACTRQSSTGRVSRSVVTPRAVQRVATSTTSPPVPVVAQTPPAVTVVLSGANPQLTPDGDGQVVQLPAGTSFLVNLGGGVDWLVTWTPPDAVQPVLTTTRPVGSQGYYVIDGSGRTVLMTASGPGTCPTPAAAPQSCTPGRATTVRITIVTGPAAP
jgi:hypothetical protein